MTATKLMDTILSAQDLPAELVRLGSSHHERDEPETAVMLSGLAGEPQPDPVICRWMLRCKLVVPAHDGVMAQSAWRLD